ncbi:MAG: aldo/keto reductase, partial [Paludibacteraceae bacterium]|nr:aldo/keto reductase [Paludibacteraceae bacterium]
PADKQKEACEYLRQAHVPCLIGQYKANIIAQQTLIENLPVAIDQGTGFICFSPLAQGLLTDRYLNGIPEGSRATKEVFLHRAQITPEVVERSQRLNQIAQQRGQSLAQMALAWLLAQKGVTSVLIGASSVNQLDNNLHALDNTTFTQQELDAINDAIKE